MNDQQDNLRPVLRPDLRTELQPGGASQDAAPTPPSIRCEEIESLALLRACDELDAGMCAALDAHAALCPDCSAVLLRESRLQQAITSLEQPADSLDRSGLLLAQCRSELAEALDDQAASSARSAWPSFLSPAAWWGGLRHTLIYHPAMSMTVLVIAGFLAGVAGQRWPIAPQQVAATHPAMTVSATPKITDQQLQSAGSAHVAWVTPAGTGSPTVQVQFMSQTPMNVVGAPDDAEVQRALTFVLKNSQQFDPDARLNSLDVLRTRAADPEVRESLCAAARLDGNPGVRIKAIEALRGFELDPTVRGTLLDALQNDDSSGVRVAAINLLSSALQSANGSALADPQTVDVLRNRLRDDSNKYVRLQSAAALRALGEQ